MAYVLPRIRMLIQLILTFTLPYTLTCSLMHIVTYRSPGYYDSGHIL